MCSGRRRWYIPTHTHVTFGGKEGNRLAAPVARMNANNTEMNTDQTLTMMAVARDDIRKQLSSYCLAPSPNSVRQKWCCFYLSSVRRNSREEGGTWEVVSIWLLLNPLKNPLFPRSSSCACQSWCSTTNYQKVSITRGLYISFKRCI